MKVYRQAHPATTGDYHGVEENVRRKCGSEHYIPYSGYYHNSVQAEEESGSARKCRRDKSVADKNIESEQRSLSWIY